MLDFWLTVFAAAAAVLILAIALEALRLARLARLEVRELDATLARHRAALTDAINRVAPPAS